MCVTNIETTLHNLLTSLLKFFPPETAHNLTIRGLKLGLAKFVPRGQYPPNSRVVLKNSKLNLPNRIGLAAGFDKNAEVYNAMLRLGFGFVECGTVTPEPQSGNPSPRIFRLSEDQGVINRLGFNNLGLGKFTRNLSLSTERTGPVGANIGANKASVEAGHASKDYITGIKAVWPYADYITLNVSSPNTPGLRNLQFVDELKNLLEQVGLVALSLCQSEKFRPLFLKIAPDMDDKSIEQIARASLEAPHLHGLVVSNTTVSRPGSLSGRYREERGGLSGKPLGAMSTEILKAVASEVGDRLDLIGVGGIFGSEDVQTKLDAGAQAVQLYTGLTFRGFDLIDELVKSEY